MRLRHVLCKITSETEKIAVTIFFVNIFAYGRGLFATIFATRVSTEGIVILSYVMSIINVVNMVIFGMLSIISMEVAKAKNNIEYQQCLASFFTVSCMISCAVIIFMSVFMFISSQTHGELSVKFIITYLFGLIPFIFSTTLRYILLSHSYTSIIRKTNIITFVLCILFTLIIHYFFELSIISFSIGCGVGFVYNLFHLLYFSIKKEVVTYDLFSYLKGINRTKIVNLIYEGCKVSVVYASDAIVIAIIILLTLTYQEHYVIAIQVSLQIFLFTSFWITGFSNGIMITLPKYQSIKQSKKAMIIVINYILKSALKYSILVSLILIPCLGIILTSIFNLSGDSYKVASQEAYLILILIFFDFIRQSLFYILRLFNKVNVAIGISYSFFFCSVLMMIIFLNLRNSPVTFLIFYIGACICISGCFLCNLYGRQFTRR